MIDQCARGKHERWLLELTQIPTAAGREGRVIRWLERWLGERPGLRSRRDACGNIEVLRGDDPDARADRSATPALYITAHLDHPAFAVERVIAPGVVQLAFRGGVHERYFAGARVVVHTREDRRLAGRLTGPAPVGCALFKSFEAEVGDTSGVRVGDIATWDLPSAEIADGRIHTHACDNLAGAAAALAALDAIGPRDPAWAVRLLFTRAEEIGFVGAIGACRHATMPPGSRVLVLENSRAMADSPVGGGPIVRVGDRVSVFSPALTAGAAKRAEELAARRPGWKWQRRLMPGGACEASVYCAAGYEATCLCLPLGNYHNMGGLEAVEAGGAGADAPATIAREYVSLDDFHGLVDLLVACAERLPMGGAFAERIGTLWGERAFVLAEDPGWLQLGRV